MPKHTIETLTKDLQGFKKEVRGTLRTMQPQVQEMHEYIIDQKGYARGQSSATASEKGANLNITAEVLKLLALALTIIAALVGANKIT